MWSQLEDNLSRKADDFGFHRCVRHGVPIRYFQHKLIFSAQLSVGLSKRLYVCSEFGTWLEACIALERSNRMQEDLNRWGRDLPARASTRGHYSLVEGSGQVVHWKDCWIKVYEKGSKPLQEEYSKCSGHGTVPGTLEVLFSGAGGKIKV